MSDDREYAAWGDEDEGDDHTEVVALLEPGTFYADRFQVDGRLGMGAMGRVVTATDLVSKQRVALKVLHREKAAQREAVERFAREAQVLARLGHPGIVRVIGSDVHKDGTRWLAMELIEGDTIAQRIRKRGPFTPTDAYAILTVLCDALDAAHREGIVHRDLKPENIMLPASGQPPCKILDFGLARVVQQGQERLTRAGTILGTPRYMAPELIQTLKDTDHRADVFAVGVIAFEMLTGKSIYAAEDVGQLFGAIMEGRTRTLRELRPDLPAALEAVIVRAASRDPSARFQTAGAFAEAYAAALGIPSQRSRLAPAHELFGEEDDATKVNEPAPLLDPFAPSLPRPAAVPVVAIAPVRAVSDRPGASVTVGSQRAASPARMIASSKATAYGPAYVAPQPSPAFSAPQPSIAQASIAQASIAQASIAQASIAQAPAPQPVAAYVAPAYVAPTPAAAPPSQLPANAQPGAQMQPYAAPTYGSPQPGMGQDAGAAAMPPEGQRPYSDRPPPYPGADQKAPSVFPPRARSFTPPVGMQQQAPVVAAPAGTSSFAAPPAAAPRRRVGLWVGIVVFVLLAALGAGVAMHWVISSGLWPH